MEREKKRPSSATSRRNAQTKRGILKYQISAPNSVTTTPKRIIQQDDKIDFVITGKQIKNERTNSVPIFHRRQSMDSLLSSEGSSRNTTLEEFSDLTLTPPKGPVTSTPRISEVLISNQNDPKKVESETYRSHTSCSSISCQPASEVSSASHDLTLQSSDESPRVNDVSLDTARTQMSTSSNYSSWNDSTIEVRTPRNDGEWREFWDKYQGQNTQQDPNITSLQLTEVEIKKLLECTETINEIIKKSTIRNEKNLIKNQTKIDIAVQTDISLPFTKSAPRIFERILRQLSRSSIDESSVEKKESKSVEKECELEVIVSHDDGKKK